MHAEHLPAPRHRLSAARRGSGEHGGGFEFYIGRFGFYAGFRFYRNSFFTPGPNLQILAAPECSYSLQLNVHGSSQPDDAGSANASNDPVFDGAPTPTPSGGGCASGAAVAGAAVP